MQLRHMNEPTVGAYTIGQTPRPDLTEELTGRFASARFQLVGALDGLEGTEIPACPPRGYPLETKLSDGTRVVVDAAFVAPLLQKAVAELDPRVSAHLVLCAGPFPKLAATAPLIRPFDVAVSHLTRRGLRRLDVLVPFAEQAAPAMDKWGAAGFGCRAHVLEERPRHLQVPAWISGLLRHSRAQALVFDYVGTPTTVLDEVGAVCDLPVLELGRLALDALEETLDTL